MVLLHTVQGSARRESLSMANVPLLPMMTLLLVRLVSAMLEPWLFMDLLDVDNSTWGLVTPRANTVRPVVPAAGEPRPPPADYATGSQVLAVFPSLSPTAKGQPQWYEVYVSNATGWEPFTTKQPPVHPTPQPRPPVEDYTVQLLRFRTTDFSSYSEPESVLRLDGLKTEEGNTVLKSIARNEKTGLMVMMVDLPGRKLLEGSYGTMTSRDGGSSWQIATCDTGCIHTPDKDDLNVLYDTKAEEFVDLQIMWRMNLTMKYCDGNLQGQCQARAVSAKTSTDGANWSPDIGPLLPDSIDPPELQFYRARGFYLGGGSTRLAAHALQFVNAPGPEILGYGYGRQPPKCKPSTEHALKGRYFCHAPHLHEVGSPLATPE